jgi:branched-chain amino acid transport system ATP-binding protein
MLVLKDISKSFGDVHALSGINLCLEQGLVYTLIGGNGSGKTTLINIISRFLASTNRVVKFKGRKVGKFTPYRVNRLGIGRTFQDLRLAMQLTVHENILLAMGKRMSARRGGNITKEARLKLEAETGKKVFSPINAKRSLAAGASIKQL